MPELRHPPKGHPMRYAVLAALASWAMVGRHQRIARTFGDSNQSPLGLGGSSIHHDFRGMLGSSADDSSQRDGQRQVYPQKWVIGDGIELPRNDKAPGSDRQAPGDARRKRGRFLVILTHAPNVLRDLQVSVDQHQQNAETYEAGIRTHLNENIVRQLRLPM